MSFRNKIKEKIMGFSNSYIYYKNNYEKLKVINSNQQQLIKEQKKRIDVYEKESVNYEFIKKEIQLLNINLENKIDKLYYEEYNG